jgi:L-arabinose isomerase
MKNHQQPLRLALLSLSMELYQKSLPATIPKYQAFHQVLAGKLGLMGQVVAQGLCFSRQEVETTVVSAESLDADVLVVVFQSYHPSLNALSALVNTRLPLLFWNTQRLRGIGADFSINDMLENHGMHGVQDLCSCLRRAGRNYGIVSGHFEDQDHLKELEIWVKACAAVSLGRKMKVGMLGRPLDGMGDFLVNPTCLQSRWGPSVHRLSLADLGAQVEAAQPDLVDQAMAFDRANFEFSSDITDEDHRRSARLTVALRQLVRLNGLHAFTQHFGLYGEDSRCQTCPFLGINHLAAEGVGYAGEGDVLTAALDATLGFVFGRSSFCEMFTADYEHNRVFFYHMGEGNYAMAREGQKPVLKKVPYTFGNGHPYLVPVFAYTPGPSTFVNIATDGECGFRLIAFEAEVTDWSCMDTLTAPHFTIQVAGKLGDLLDAYSVEGGTHHLARVEGRQAKRLAHLARMLGMELALI